MAATVTLAFANLGEIPLKATDKHWEDWGQKAPYYGVATDEMFRNPDSAALEEFFRTGERHIEDVMAKVRSFRPDFQPSRAVDFGCGTGRLLVSMSRLSPVVGIDISTSMLAEARKNVDARGIGQNVDLQVSDDGLTRLSGDFDFIHSHIVFQHIPVPRGMAIASQLLGRLRSGGIAVLHFTYDRDARVLRRLLSWSRAHIPPLHYLVNLLKGQSGAPMQMNLYDVRRLFRLFRQHRCTVHRVEFTDHGGTVGAVFFLSR